MNLVLDTSALFHKPLLRNLVRLRQRAGHGPMPVTTVLPAIAYIERLRQLRRDGQDEMRWKRNLKLAGIQIEPLGPDEAERLHPDSFDDAVWARHARDHLLRLHVHGNRVAVSDDEGPGWNGVPLLPSARAAAAVAAFIPRRS